MNKSDLKSLDFAVDRLFMKMFKTVNIEIGTECQKRFDFELPGVIVDERCSKFGSKYNALSISSENLLCKICGNFVD